jgi:hypothetical protein
MYLKYPDHGLTEAAGLRLKSSVLVSIPHLYYAGQVIVKTLGENAKKLTKFDLQMLAFGKQAC